MTTESPVSRFMLSRYALLLLASTAVGMVSGLFHPMIMGVRGAILASMISFGLVVLNWLSRRDLDADHPPRWLMAFVIGAVFGTLGGLAVNLFGLGGQTAGGDFPPVPTPAGWPTILVGALFGVGLHSVYALRWRIRVARWFFTVILVGLAGGICTLLRMVVDPGAARISGSEAVLLFALFSGIPFGIMWGLAAVLCDPAWSPARWRRIHGR